MKLGKLPFVEDQRDLRFGTYRLSLSALPSRPTEFGHEALVTDWGMLANDNYGDCVLADAAHATKLWAAIRTGADTLRFTDENVLAAYAAITGFDPLDPSTDRGTNIRTALKWRRRHGICDAAARWHRIEGFASINPAHWEHVLDAVYLFGAASIGIQVPSSAMDQFSAGQAWDVVANPGSVEGGHDVPIVAWRGGLLWTVSWGRLQAMTPAFFQRYCDEAWAVFDDEMLRAGQSVEGFSAGALLADLAVIG